VNDRTVCGLTAMAAAMLLAAPVPAQRREGSARRARAPQIQPGQPAPDVELSPLRFAPDEKGEMVGRIGTEKVKLSDFQGKAPICIFSSSYT